MSHLIVHAGFPKCGSTAIFAGLQQQFDALKAQNILILNRNFEPAPKKELAQPPLWEIEAAVRTPPTAKAVKKKITAALDQADPDAKLILSSENLANKVMPKRLLQGIDKAHEVTAVFYMRPQVHWIPSAWKQWDMHEGLTLCTTVEKYIELQRPAYLAVLQAWKETLPNARIILRPLVASELYKNDPIRDFCHQIGATFDSSAPPAPKSNQNPSIDHALMHLMMTKHDLFFSGRHNSSFMFRLLEHLPDTYKRTNAAMLSQLTCSDIFDKYYDENLILARDYMKMDDPGGFLNKYFRHTVEGDSYETMSEDRVMLRAEKIMKEVFDVDVPRENLAQSLFDVVDARSARRAV